jgi:hypothetical protein
VHVGWSMSVGVICWGGSSLFEVVNYIVLVIEY